MARFVIHEHRKDNITHWDIMFETGAHLTTWQVAVPPTQWLEPVPCEKIFDHRIEYLTYEGAISKNRGSVRIVAAGEFEPENIDENYWRISLVADKIKGVLKLLRNSDSHWSLAFYGIVQ